nr:MAG TPA: Chromatin remodeling complex ATPase [Crassvirales sp.]
MTREEVLEEVKTIPNRNVLLTLPTGFGKSRNAIERIKHFAKRKHKNLLIVIPRNVLKVSWTAEFAKWWADCKLNITFTTYVSFPKHKGSWDFIIFDEAHHLSERCREALCDFTTDYTVLLSATVKKDLREELKEVFDDLYYYNTALREAIDNGVLPDPTVYLLPLSLDNRLPNERIIKNPKAKGRVIYSSWAERWSYIRQKSNPVHIFCTQVQYLDDLNGQIEWFKNRRGNIVCKNRWLKLCGDRLKYLSDCKVPTVLRILQHCGYQRTLTFCNSIEQTKRLGEYCINSQNSKSSDALELFNKGIVHHITACNMLNEGMNLIDCRVGIYANLNSSETIIKQRAGRLLRHSHPIIIIPYYKGTREEELVEKMLEDYNPDLVKTVNFVEEIQL